MTAFYALYKYEPTIFLFWLLFTIIFFLIVFFNNMKTNKVKNYKLLFVFWVYIILLITLICRIPRDRYRYNIKPLYEIVYVVETGKLSSMLQFILNIFMFVPYGYLLSNILKNKKRIIISGFNLSLLIEIMQYITKRGWFEVDDIITNTIGCIIGLIINLSIIRRCKQCNRR